MPPRCPACRQPVEDEAEICLGCGEPLGHAAEPRPVSTGVAKEGPVASPSPAAIVPRTPAPGTFARRALRRDDEVEALRCPGCGTRNPADRDRCRGCGSPQKRA